MIHSERVSQLLRAKQDEVHWNHHRDAARLLSQATLECHVNVWVHAARDRGTECV
jgi:hypothetical protein